MSMIQKLIIIDEFLENKVGHYYEYDKSVIESFQQQGVSYRLYTKDSVSDEIKDELNAIPFFQYNPKSFLRKIKWIGPFLYRFKNWHIVSKQIQSIITTEYEEGKGIVFFAPNIFWYNVIPYALAFRKLKCPVKVLYRTSVLETIEISEKFKPLIFKLNDWGVKAFSKNKQVHFVTDSEVIAQQFTEKYHQPMSVLPIPHVFEMEDKLSVAHSQIRLYLPGGARIEKGMNAITGALELLQKNHPEMMKKIVIVLQFFGEKEKDELDALQDRISQLSCEKIFLGKLSSEEYKEQVGLADIILIPYLNSRGYKARTSGVLAEAIAACKPFITSKESWMDCQVKNYHSGYAVTDTSADELAAGILHIAQHYQQYKRDALAAKDKWLAFHSKENFVRIFTSAQ